MKIYKLTKQHKITHTKYLSKHHENYRVSHQLKFYRTQMTCVFLLDWKLIADEHNSALAGTSHLFGNGDVLINSNTQQKN